MILTAVIVEQLDLDGNLRTFRMKSRYGGKLAVAFAGEYDEPRTGPFHFLEHQDGQDFQSGFAECSSKKLSIERYRKIERGYEFKTSWRGISTERQETSYYALSLPMNTVPTMVRFVDPRSDHEYQKSVIKDLQRNCFVLYLECRSSYGKFDFDLVTQFTDPTEHFESKKYDDHSTISCYAKPFDFGGIFKEPEKEKIWNFFNSTHVGDVFNTVQAGSVGPGSKVKSQSFDQVGIQAIEKIDFQELAIELGKYLELAKTCSADKNNLEHMKSIEDAIHAANSGDSASVMKHLRDVGKWMLNHGGLVGSAVLVNAISWALGF